MNKKWLTTLLLASWTLNVMLGVAYYLKSHYPTGGYWMSETLRPHHPEHRNEIFRNARKEFSEKAAPVIVKRRQLISEMAHIFTEDEIDSVKLNRLSDSLDIINSGFHRKQLSHLREMHGRIPPEERPRMAKRLMRRLDRNHDFQRPPHHRGKRHRGNR